MFDLEEHLRRWRTSASLVMPQDAVLDELESHLRDEFGRLLASEESPERAWNLAIATLGEQGQLAREFSKAHRRRWIPEWIAGGVLTLIAVAVVALMARGWTSGRVSLLLAAHVLAVTVGYTAVYATGFLGICAIVSRLLMGWTFDQQSAFRAAGIRLTAIATLATLLGIILGAFWAHGAWGNWWTWDPKETAGLFVLAWSGLLLQAFRSHQSTPQSLMCLTIVGNMLVSLCWFGVNLIDGNHMLHSYGNPHLGTCLSGFLFTQVLMIALTLLPTANRSSIST